jgi:hypothetical protein
VSCGFPLDMAQTPTKTHSTKLTTLPVGKDVRGSRDIGSNENKMSDGGRERALLGVEVRKSSEM